MFYRHHHTQWLALKIFPTSQYARENLKKPEVNLRPTRQKLDVNLNADKFEEEKTEKSQA